MAQLLFFDEGHKYTLDGEELPSVSQLTRFISREIYGDVGQFNLDRAADRGTAVHKATELLDKYGTAEIDEDISPYLKAYIAFRKEHKCEWQKIEYATHHPENLYAGTLDRVGTVDGKLVVLDIKTSSTIQKPLYTAQLNLYRKMLPDPIEQLVILHLKKDGTYKLIDIPIDDTLADACITMHEALKKKKRSKKNA
jgi:hypothetical protein